MTIYTTDFERPIAGSTYIPDSMEARGDPKPLAPFPGITNGLGEEVRAGAWGYDWGFDTLNRVEMDWWATLLGYQNNGFTDSNSKRFVWNGAFPAVRLWDLDGYMKNFRTAVIYMPTWERYRNGYFHNCVVRFRRMEETLS